MNAPAHPTDPTMAEPGKRPTGADIELGGKVATGSAPSASAGTEQPASEDRATPSRGTQRGDGSSATDARAKRGDDDDEDEWRHEPIAAVNEANPLRSLGKAVGEAVTGSSRDTAKPRKR